VTYTFDARDSLSAYCAGYEPRPSVKLIPCTWLQPQQSTCLLVNNEQVHLNLLRRMQFITEAGDVGQVDSTERPLLPEPPYLFSLYPPRFHHTHTHEGSRGPPMISTNTLLAFQNPPEPANPPAHGCLPGGMVRTCAPVHPTRACAPCASLCTLGRRGRAWGGGRDAEARRVRVMH
jgi:hypothetical protein